MTDVAAYVRHAELYGPECIFETAATDLNDRDRGELKAFLDSKDRVYRWKNGRWEERPNRGTRQCEHCGLDLPPGARAGTRFHKHCQKTASSRRQRARTVPQALQTGAGDS